MKLFLSFLLLLALPYLGLQPGIYIHETNGFAFTLTLNQDSSFSYLSRSMLNNTLIETGKWRVDDNFITLYDSIGIEISKNKITGKTIEQQNFVHLEFKDEDGNPLQDLYVVLNERTFFKRTDNKGVVDFNYSELKKRRRNQPDNTVELITLRTKEFESTMSVENIFNNTFTVIHDFHPQTYYKPRERKLEIRNGNILFRNPTGRNAQQEWEFRKKEQ